MIEMYIRTRKGHEAVRLGSKNRFGFMPYQHEIPQGREVLHKVVYHAVDGRTVHPADDDFDSVEYVRKEELERKELAKRRAKDNWI